MSHLREQGERTFISVTKAAVHCLHHVPGYCACNRVIAVLCCAKSHLTRQFSNFLLTTLSRDCKDSTRMDFFFFRSVLLCCFSLYSS